MKGKIFKGFILGIIIVLAFSSLVFADDMGMSNGTTKKAGNVSVQLSFKNEKVKTGKNDIMLTLKDDMGKAISDAKVSATAEMDKNMSMNMDSTKPQNIEFMAGDEKGQYMGTVNFTDKGKWIVKAAVNGNNVEFDVDVVSAGANWYLIGGFLGVVALVLIVAAVKKKNTVKA